MTTPYCGLCDGEHHPRDCAATARIQRSERAAEAPPNRDNIPAIEEWLDRP